MEMDLDRNLIEKLATKSASEFAKLWQEAEADSPEAGEYLLVHRCATDIELFAQVFFPHYCRRRFNAFHRFFFDKWRLEFSARGIRRATAAPRGAAKSTLATLIKPLHDVCYGLERFILILSSTGPLADKKLKDIRSEVFKNRKLRAVFGLHFDVKRPGKTEFNVLSRAGRVHFAALGRGSEVRGIRDGENRPTKIVSDDVEYSEEVYAEANRIKTASWYFEDVTKAGDSDDEESGDLGTNFEFIGTVLHRDSLLAKLLKNPGYTGTKFQAILEWSQREDLWDEWRTIYRNVDRPDREAAAIAFYETHKAEMLRGTRVLWPEKEDYLAHMKDMEEIGRIAFMKEKQNDPLGSEDLVFSNFHFYEETPTGILIESSGKVVPWERVATWGAAMDPSTGKSSARRPSDFTEILTGFQLFDGRVCFHHDFTERKSPTKCIQEVFNLHERFGYDKVAVETNLYRALLMENMADEKERRDKVRLAKPKREDEPEYKDFEFYEVEQTENKIERVTRLEPKVNHGKILFNRALSRRFMMMFEDFPKGDHDDAPDAGEILWNLFHNVYEPSAVGLNLQRGR